jgi:hypothetical protein
MKGLTCLTCGVLLAWMLASCGTPVPVPSRATPTPVPSTATAPQATATIQQAAEETFSPVGTRALLHRQAHVHLR